MERKIGEEFDFLGCTMKTEKSELENCTGCFFFHNRITCYSNEIVDITGECIRCLRQDGNNVIFKVV